MTLRIFQRAARAASATWAASAALGLSACTSVPQTIQGTTVDRLTGEPLVGSAIRLGYSQTQTDAHGNFRIEQLDDAPKRLEVTAPGYLAISRLVRADETHVVVTLAKERSTEDEINAFFTGREEQRIMRDNPLFDPALRLDAPSAQRDEVGSIRAALDGPPTTIRIWRRSIDGQTDSCSPDTRIDVLNFEDYVKGVVPHEWIASWRDESLLAGSLAVRTYSANWVARGGKYDCADLDDTTRSQVYRDDIDTRASALVDQTRGQVIVRDGEMVSGEYSAENASPTADGVVDTLCEGRKLFGHGRGMCQWGTQRWAGDGQDHTWMAEHYWPGASVQSLGKQATRSASLTASDAPATMYSGERAVAWFEVTNDGSIAWSMEDTLLVVTDGDLGFFDPSEWESATDVTYPDSDALQPGARVRFTFSVLAPSVTDERVVTQDFSLSQVDGALYGPALPLAIRVRPARDLQPDGGLTPRKAKATGCATTRSTSGANNPIQVLFAVLATLSRLGRRRK